MRKVLLIGNGPSATSMKLGKEIDEFDGKVVRFNSYRIPGFEEYVGTRTDIWITTDIFPAWHKEYEDVILCSFNRKPDNRLLLEMRKYYPNAHNFPEWAWQSTIKEMGFNAPSSGAVASVYFGTVYIYGFDFFGGPKHHYGDSVAMGTNHRGQKELSFFRKRITDGKAVPFHNYLDGLNYSLLHNIQKGYGAGGGWFTERIRDIAKANNVKTILDYGCGKGGLVRALKRDFDAYGYDPYVDEYATLDIDAVDMVVSTDFWEHIGRDEIDDTIARISALHPRVQFHAVSNRKAAQILPNGHNAHQIVESAKWWRNVLSQFGIITNEEHNDRQNFTMFTIRNGDVAWL